MKFGKYVAVDVVALTGHGSVFTARRAAGGAVSFAVKQYKSPQTDPDEPHWDCQHFLDRARVQKSVVASGGRYWVPVHDMGLNEQGAWVVMDCHPLSAQKLIDNGVRLKPAALHNLTNSVIKGLVELQQVRRRAHGNLRPSNVLICGGADLAEAPVMLTDPAQGVCEPEAGDLYAVGNLIHELVLHRPFAGPGQWPVQDEEGWQRLGIAGAQWRELCRALLNPTPELRPPLVDVARSLRSLAPKQRVRMKIRKRYLLVPGAAAALVLIAMGALALAVSSARNQLDRAKKGWVDAFAAAVADPDRRTRYQTDPDLKRVLDFLDLSRVAVPLRGGRLASNFSPLELYRLRNRTSAVERILQDLSPQRWRRLHELAMMQQEYRGRGWDQPADYLDKLIAATQPRPWARVVDGIDHLLRVEPALKDKRADVESAWEQLRAHLSQLESTRDQTLNAFARSLRLSGADAVKLSDAGFEGLEKLHSTDELAGRLATAARSGWPGNVDATRLAADVRRDADLTHPRPQDMELWLNRFPLYSVRRTETALAAADLRKRLNAASDAVDNANSLPDERAIVDEDRASIDAAIDRLADARFIEKEFEDGTFAGQRDRIAARIDGLPKLVHPQKPVDWIKALPALKTASQKVNSYWEQWKQSQLASAGKSADQRGQLAAMKVRAEAMQTSLGELAKRFPAAPTDLPDAFNAAAQRRRDREIASLLRGIDPQAPQVDALKMTGASAAYEDWCATLRKLSQDFPIRKEFLSPDDRPDEKWALQDGFWNDPEIQQLVKADVDRLSQLRGLADEPREALVRTASESSQPELAFQAWRLLGRNELRPEWPGNAGEFAAELRMRRRLDQILAKLRDPSARAGTTDVLREQGPARWRRFVEVARGEADLQSAWELRNPFSVGPAQVANLSPVARYNLWLWQSRQALAENDQAALGQALDRLVTAAGELKDRPEAASLPARLSGASAKEPFADQNPGDLFRVALLGVQPPVEFKRVESQSGRSFYLCTTEVSVGQFAAAVEAAGAWKQAGELPWSYKPSQADVRRGPRSWEWVAQGGVARLSPPQLWLTPDDANDFAPPLRASRFNRMSLAEAVGGGPSDQHPMQQVSAQAALWFAGICECRLPTAREWLTAYETYEKKGTIEQWNLRDRTFELQRAYASGGDFVAMSPPQWPDDGAFRPETYALAVARNARSRNENDGALFFRPVDASGGSVFHHLVGNVAEYLCDESEAFERLDDKRSPEAVRKFAQQFGRGLSVIGGSALSAPELPVDKPLSLPRSDQGYADVGFRLACTAPARNLAERAKWALAGQKYLWQHVSDDTDSRRGQ